MLGHPGIVTLSAGRRDDGTDGTVGHLGHTATIDLAWLRRLAGGVQSITACLSLSQITQPPQSVAVLQTNVLLVSNALACSFPHRNTANVKCFSLLFYPQNAVCVKVFKLKLLLLLLLLLLFSHRNTTSVWNASPCCLTDRVMLSVSKFWVVDFTHRNTVSVKCSVCSFTDRNAVSVRVLRLLSYQQKKCFRLTEMLSVSHVYGCSFTNRKTVSVKFISL